MSRFAFRCIFLLMCFCPFPAIAEETGGFSISGGSVAGVYFHIAEELCQFTNQAANDDSKCQSRSGYGSTFNIKALEDNLFEFALAQSDLQWNAWYGLDEWANAPATHIRSVATLHNEAVHLIVRTETKIKSVFDLKGRSVSVGNRASGQRKNALTVLDLYKLDLKRDMTAYGLLQGNVLSRIKSGELDAFFYTVGYPAHSISRLSETVQLDYLDLSDAVIREFIGKNSPYHEIKIPAHTYTNQDHAISTFGTYGTLLSSTYVSDERVYELLSILYDRFDDFKASHPSLSRLQLDGLAKNLTVPLHGGAKKFYREKGLLSPTLASHK